MFHREAKYSERERNLILQRIQCRPIGKHGEHSFRLIWGIHILRPNLRRPWNCNSTPYMTPQPMTMNVRSFPSRYYSQLPRLVILVFSDLVNSIFSSPGKLKLLRVTATKRGVIRFGNSREPIFRVTLLGNSQISDPLKARPGFRHFANPKHLLHHVRSRRDR